MLHVFAPTRLAPRCVSCGARWWERRQGCGTARSECTHCGLVVGENGLAQAAEALAGLDRTGRVRLPAGAAWFADDYTFRIAASRHRLWFTPDDGNPIAGHAERPARGRLETVAARHDDPPVTLVVLARPGDPRLADCLARHASAFARTIVMLDTERENDARALRAECARTWGADVDIVCRRLCDDFGAQRNAAQQCAPTGWTFHLDADESLPPRLLAMLAPLAGRAAKAGLRAVGFARRNLVDATPSDLFPDVQYRLVATDVRYAQPVHERPDACDTWPTTTIWRGDAIDHHLTLVHVHARQARYEAMGQHRDRDGDTEALLRPYRG